jgi:hypothetical protein
MSTKDRLTEKNLRDHTGQAQTDSMMSLTWGSQQDVAPSVRPAGEGPLMREFYAEVAREMREQDAIDLERMRFAGQNFGLKVNRAQRGSQWRAWVTALALGIAGGMIGALAIWTATNGR